MKTIALIILGFFLNSAFAQTSIGTEFTYQGELNNASGKPHEGAFDFKFTAYDEQDDGSGDDVGTSLADDVEVRNGIFTTQIDFGGSAFYGDEIWLEISVRSGTSTGAYTKLLPRQQITVVPYAIHAKSVGLNAVSGAEIQDGSVTSNELANFSITSAKVATNSITENKLADSSVTTDKIAAHSITLDRLANGAVNSKKVLDGSLRAIDIDSTEIQQRVGGSCDDGFYLNGINQDGTVLCKKLPIGLPFTLDNTDEAGSNVSMAIGADGNPVISYRSKTSGQLRAFKCSNVACSAGSSYSLDNMGLEPSNSYQSVTSIAIGTNGNPMIAYWDSINNYLKIYRCSNPSCSAGTSRVLDDSGDVGGYPSIAIGSDNYPAVSYYDATNEILRYYKCFNTSCSSGLPITIADMNDIGYNSMTIGADGNPVISYSDRSNIRLNVFKCSVPSCITGSDVNVDGSTYESRIAIGTDNNPIISFSKVPSGEIWVHKCDNSSCSAGTTVVIDSDAFGSNSIAIGADGNPIISYSFNGLNIYKCRDISCSSGSLVALKTGSRVGEHSLAIGNDGNPIISYFDGYDDTLKVYSCVDQRCSQ